MTKQSIAALQALASAILTAVGNLNPVAKAVTAAATPFLGALINMAVAGKVDTTTLVLFGVSVASAAFTYLVPNRPAPKARSASAKAKPSK